MGGAFAGDFEGVLAGDLAGDLACDLALCLAGDLTGDLVGDLTGDLAGVLAGVSVGVGALVENAELVLSAGRGCEAGVVAALSGRSVVVVDTEAGRLAGGTSSYNTKSLLVNVAFVSRIHVHVHTFYG